jgi:hypothetical protein
LRVGIELAGGGRAGVDPGGVGAAGANYLGFVEVTTGPDGAADFSASLPAGGSAGSARLLPGGYFLTATATARPAGLDAETSEFSPGVPFDTPNPAHVVRAFVNGTAWRPEFRRALGNHGSPRFGYLLYDDYDSWSALPWVNIDEVSVGFSADVHVEADDLVVRGERVPRYAVRSFRYDPYTLTATWRLARVFAYDRVTIELASGENGVRSVAGNVPLDGERVNQRPSGDGTPGGNYVNHFEVWRGDTDRAAGVTENDFYRARQQLGSTTRTRSPDGSSVFDPLRDVNGSGRIDRLDLAYVARSFAEQPAATRSGGTVSVTRGFFRPKPSAFSFSA